MPWTTIEFGEAQIEPGKPRYPLNAGVAPCERMYFSAASSRSAVVTPSRTFDSSSLSVRTRMAPAAAILSISAGGLRVITARYRVRARARRAAGGPRSEHVLHAERLDRRAEVVVDLGRAARAVEAAQDVAVVVVLDERRGLVAVDVEPRADRLLAVVLALVQRLAVDVAAVVVPRRVVLDVVHVAVRAHAPPRQPPHDVVGRHVDEERRAQAAAHALERLVERLRLLGRAREAVEQEAVRGVLVAEAIEDHADDHVVGHELAAVHVPLGLAAQVRALLHRRAQDVAGGDVGQREVVLQALGLGALARTG